MDEYFVLAAADKERLAELHGPVDVSGEPFPNFEPIDPAARGICRCVDGRTRLADCAYCVTDLIISERAARIFKTAVLAKGTQFLPVDVVGNDGRILGEMAAVRFSEIVEAVDLEASKYEKLSTGMLWYFTAPPVLRASQLKGLDLLLSFNVFYLCSARLRREIAKEELTNFMFETVVVTSRS